MASIHRHTVHSSYHFEADFLIYHKNGMLVSYVVRGKHLPVNGEVEKATFYRLLKEIQQRELSKAPKSYFNAIAKEEAEAKAPTKDHYSATRGAEPFGYGEVYKAGQKYLAEHKCVMSRSEWQYTYWA